MTFKGRPLMPPSLLIFSSIMSTRPRSGWPMGAMKPLNELTKPSVTGSSALAGAVVAVADGFAGSAALVGVAAGALVGVGVGVAAGAQAMTATASAIVTATSINQRLFPLGIILLLCLEPSPVFQGIHSPRHGSRESACPLPGAFPWSEHDYLYYRIRPVPAG